MLLKMFYVIKKNNKNSPTRKQTDNLIIKYCRL